MSLARIWTIATNGFREVIRDRIFYFLGFFVLLLVMAWQLLPEIAATTEDKIFLDFGLGAIGLLSAIIAILVGTGLINKEISKKTVLFLIPKPLSRAELIVGKHLGLSAVLILMVAAMSAVYLGLLSWSQISYPVGSIFIALFYLLLELFLLAAAALIFGVFTSEVLATLLAFCLYLAGHFSRDLLELGKISDNEGVQTLTQSLYLVLPDLSRLNFRNEAVYGLLPSPGEFLSNIVYGLAYTILLLTIAMLIIWRQEY